MFKINTIILFCIIFFLIKYFCKKEETGEKYNYNFKIIPKLKNNQYKYLNDIYHTKFKKDDNLEKSSQKFNKENKPVYKNYQKKKIEFNYDSLSDKNNLKIKNFKKKNLLSKTIENFENDNLMYDKNGIALSESISHIREKSDNIVEKHNFHSRDENNAKILEKMNQKEDTRIEFEPFGNNILERRQTSKPYKKPLSASQLNNFKGKTIREIYNEVTKNEFNINKNTNIFGFENLN